MNVKSPDGAQKRIGHYAIVIMHGELSSIYYVVDDHHRDEEPVSMNTLGEAQAYIMSQLGMENGEYRLDYTVKVTTEACLKAGAGIGDILRKINVATGKSKFIDADKGNVQFNVPVTGVLSTVEATQQKIDKALLDTLEGVEITVKRYLLTPSPINIDEVTNE